MCPPPCWIQCRTTFLVKKGGNGEAAFVDVQILCLCKYMQVHSQQTFSCDNAEINEFIQEEVELPLAVNYIGGGGGG